MSSIRYIYPYTFIHHNKKHKPITSNSYIRMPHMLGNHHHIHTDGQPLPYQSALHHWDIAGKRIILRADLNVPLEDTPICAQTSVQQDGHSCADSCLSNTGIIDDFRLRSLLPTIDLILSKKGRILLITHIGRPQKATPALSTARLVSWFKDHRYDCTYAATPTDALALQPPLLLLENIRFFPGEKKQDPFFAQELAQLGDFYVNDGFGVMHRTDCSVTQLPLLFAPEKRTFGLLVEKELHELNILIHNPQKPLVLIMGGAKASDKIALIEHMITRTDTLLLCPALVFTFNKARGKSVGKSLVDTDSLNLCTRIIRKAQQHNMRIVYPYDYQVTQSSLENPVSVTPTDTLHAEDIGISIGAKTVAAYAPFIQSAGTIFFNGLPGFIDKPQTLDGVYALLDIIAHAPGKSIIAGGDTVAAVFKHGIENQIDYLSTGGGATLTYLSGQPLPGLEILLKKRAKTQ